MPTATKSDVDPLMAEKAVASGEEVKTEQVTKIQYLEEKVTCDNGHSFLAKNVKLVAFANDNSDMGDIMFIDPENKIISGCTEVPKSGYLLACPECNLIHMSGFNNTPDKATLVAGQDNTVPERSINPDL